MGDRVARQLRQAGKNLRQRGVRWHGLLGQYENSGSCAVASRGGFWWVRIRQAGTSTYSLGQFRGYVPDLYNLPVVIERDPLSGEQVIAGVDRMMIQYGIGADPDNYEPPPAVNAAHGESHVFGGFDQLDWLDTRQLYSLRVQPTGNVAEVLLQAGVYCVDGAYYLRPASIVVDLAAYVPVSGDAWILVHLDTTGAVGLLDAGSIYDDPHNNAYKMASAPAGTAGVALVRVESTATPDWADIIDLRFVTQDAGGGELQFIGMVEEVLDQANLVPITYSLTHTGLYQSFTVSRSGLISRLALYIHESMLTKSGDGYLYPRASLRAGDGNTGDVLGTARARIIPNNNAADFTNRTPTPEPLFRTLTGGTGHDLQVRLVQPDSDETTWESVRAWSVVIPLEQEDTVGGATDLWGLTWDPTDLYTGFTVRIGETGGTETNYTGFVFSNIPCFDDAEILGLAVHITSEVGADLWIIKAVSATVYYRRQGSGIAQWVELQMDIPVAVEKGLSYTVELHGEHRLGYTTGNLYPDGKAGPLFFFGAKTNDLLLKVWLLVSNNTYISIGPGGL